MVPQILESGLTGVHNVFLKTVAGTHEIYTFRVKGSMTTRLSL